MMDGKTAARWQPADASTVDLAPEPAVVIDCGTDAEGQPTFFVFLQSLLFAPDRRRSIECPDHDSALQVAQILSTCSGFRIADRAKTAR